MLVGTTSQQSTLAGAVSQLLALRLESVQVDGPGPKLSLLCASFCLVPWGMRGRSRLGAPGLTWRFACGEAEVLQRPQQRRQVGARNLALHEKSGPGGYVGVSAADGGVNVVGEDRAAWGKGTDGGAGQALEIPDSDGGQRKVSL